MRGPLGRTTAQSSGGIAIAGRGTARLAPTRIPATPKRINKCFMVPPVSEPITRKYNEGLHSRAIVQGEYSKRASYEFVYDSWAYRTINAASKPSARRAATRRSAADRSSSPPTHTRYRGGP